MADEQFNMLNGSEERAWNTITLWFRRISYICGFIFFVNLLVGKGSLIMGWNPPFLFDGVSEFLLLLFIVVMFVASLMSDEQDNKNNSSTQNIT